MEYAPVEPFAVEFDLVIPGDAPEKIDDEREVVHQLPGKRNFVVMPSDPVRHPRVDPRRNRGSERTYR